MADTLKPRLMHTQYPAEDYAVASAVATDPQFGAIPDGRTDCTAPIQSAIDAVAAIGGGAVFLPAGQYRCNGNLLLRPNVTLRGDWKQPGDSPGGANVGGTILMPTAGRGDPNGKPFITIQVGTCVRNLSIYYPDQKIEDVAPYPWTIANDSSRGGDNFTVENLTLVNCYQGVRFGPQGNELAIVRNVYGTPLKVGVSIDATTDTPRFTDVKFAPRFWLGSGLGQRPDEAALGKYLFSNATGFLLLRSDGQCLTNIAIEGYAIGVHSASSKLGTPYGPIYNLTITGGDVGLLVDDTNQVVGWQLTGCRLDGQTAAVWAKETYRAKLQFNRCQLGGTAKYALRSDGTGTVQMQNCRIFGTLEMAQKGSISLIACHLGTASSRIVLGKLISRALILGNIPVSSVENHSHGDIQIDPAPVVSAIPAPAPAWPEQPKPARAVLFNVVDYGAVADGLDAKTDNTAAFQKTLDAAGAAGGGVVYVPAGAYLLAGSLKVPTGVEIRGCFDAPHHTMSKGSLLLATGGRGEADGAPFINLAAGSGVSGLTVLYPDQQPANIVPYPWTIRSLGPRCWLVNFAGSNPYRMADFGSHPSQGHYIRYVMGAPLKEGIYCSKGSGFMQGTHFNMHYWGRMFPGGPKWLLKTDDKSVSDYMYHNLEALVFGSCPHEIQVDDLVIVDLHGLRFVDDGGPCGGWVLNHQSDGSSIGIQVDAASPDGLWFINTQIATISPDDITMPLQVSKSCTGDVVFFNGMTWCDCTYPALSLLGQGRTILQSWHLGEPRLAVANGDLVLQGVECRQTPTTNVETSAPVKRLVLVGNSSESGKFTYDPTGPVFARSNSQDALPIPLVDRFASAFESGQPMPPANIPQGWNAIAKATCLVVPGKGIASSNGLVISASPQPGAPNVAALYEIFDPSDLVIKPDTVFRYWLKPETEMGRFCAVDLTFTDGTNLRDTGCADRAGRSTHPRAGRGQVGKWYMTEAEIGNVAAGKTVKQIWLIFDAGKPTGDAVADVDNIEIGEPKD